MRRSRVSTHRERVRDATTTISAFLREISILEGAIRSIARIILIPARVCLSVCVAR